MISILLAFVLASSGPPASSADATETAAVPVAVQERRVSDGTLVLIHETVIDAPVAEVWNAVATAEGWTSWAVPVAWSPEPDVIETSYDASARPGGPDTIRQLILARVPGRMIAFRTTKAPEGFPHFDLFSRTTGRFELEQQDEGRTRVRLVGAGYPDNEAGRQLIGFFREGNKVSLQRLQRRFTEGPIDWAAMRSSGRD